MADISNIAWCDSTFNPWIGCTKVSPACDHCYAERLVTNRLKHEAWGPGAQRVRTAPTSWGKPLRWAKKPFYQCPSCNWRGDESTIKRAVGKAYVEGLSGGRCPYCAVRMSPARRRVFCASLADVFDNAVPHKWRDDLFCLIQRTPNLDWLLLTKRIGNVERLLADIACPGLPSNVWLGATICNHAEARRDVPKLLSTPAAVRFVSIEPMLGAVDLRRLLVDDLLLDALTGCWDGLAARAPLPAILPSIDWVICGGESGPNARPMHPDWARSLRDQCAVLGTPFFFKQWGEWAPRGPESMGYLQVDDVPRVRLTDQGDNGQKLGAKGWDDCWMQRSGVSFNGALLDGVEYQAWPGDVAPAPPGSHVLSEQDEPRGLH